MKRFFNFCLFLSLIICAFLCTPFSNSTTAALNNTYRTVNFYSGSTLLYSVQVPNGSSLNELDNNLLKNGDFSMNGEPSIANWYNSNNNASVVPTSEGVEVTYTGSGSGGFFIQDVDTSLYRGKDICFSAFINEEFYMTYFVPTTATGTGSSAFKTIPGLYLRIYIYSNSRMGITFDINSNLSGTALISYAKLEEGSTPTPYFSKNYIDKLYRNSNNLTSSDTVYWSQNAYGQFDFDTPINKDINLYGDDTLYHRVDFFAEDRLTLLLSSVIPHGQLLTPSPDDELLKEEFLNNQTEYKSIDDFYLLYSDNYYRYDNLFNNNFYVTTDMNIYLVPFSTSDKSIPVDDFSKFYYLENNEPNLLNSLNLNAITFKVSEMYLLSDEDDLFTFGFSSPLDNVPINEISYFNFTDNYNNTYFYKIESWKHYDSDTYYYKSILYRIEINDTEHLYFYPLPVNLFEGSDTYIGNSVFGRPGSCSYFFKYNIDYNMQYYYSDKFGIEINYSYLNDLTFYDTQNRSYLLGDYSSSNSIFGISSDYLLNSYINSFSFIINTSGFRYYPNVNNNYTDIQNSVPRILFGDEKVYFYQSNSESTGNNIIPTDSNGLYKNKQNWYDFGTDIYNMFIYILFDAPIISNITSIIYIIVSLIINVITLIIGAFSSVKSSIFIAMILGFLLFKFVIKKFTGGSS